MNIDTIHYSAQKPRHFSYLLMLVVLCTMVLLGVYCARVMEHAGHHITGMNNQVVWGLPHVFAVTLIVAASGALNAATFSSLFGANLYKPYARLSIVLALSLLSGGLAVLVLDLGRPDRLLIAMTHFNFRSIFAWNIFIYTGFMLLGIVYLWVLMEKRFNRFTRQTGSLVFVWRIVLTTGTGSIFGFLVGRNALDTALMAPLFIALSLVLGTALFVLVVALLCRWQNEPCTIPDTLLTSLRKLLLWFTLAVAYFSIVHHITNLYVSEHHAVERHLLLSKFSLFYWVGHIVIGVVLPVYWLLSDNSAIRFRRLLYTSIATIVGSMALIYSIIIGSQNTPQRLFPGKTVLASRFGDATVASYSPSLWEWGLGLGGVALAFLLFLSVMRILPLSPPMLKNTLTDVGQGRL